MRQPNVQFLQLVAALVLLMLVGGSILLASISHDYPEELMHPLHIATGWLFGALTSSAIDTAKRNGKQ